jgi:HD-like signal output (HDOD) protein/AmiR/NasT family two-component response regulator
MTKKEPKQVLMAANISYSRLLVRQLLSEDEYAVTLLESGPEAAALLESQGFDLLVVDLLNDEVNGEDLLLRARLVGWAMPTVLLTTYTDEQMVQRLQRLGPAGYLRKPIDVGKLQQLLRLALLEPGRLLALSRELDRDDPTQTPVSLAPVDRQREAVLERVVARLPALSQVAVAIMHLSHNPNTTVAEMTSVISADPALSSQLLRLVNSAHTGFARRIGTLEEAVVVLGFDTVKRLATSVSVVDLFSGPGRFWDRPALWRHALGCANAARLLARQVGHNGPGQAFVAGLLHDFGLVFLDQHLPQAVERVMLYRREQEVDLVTAEQKALGVSHAWVSGWIARRWNLPPQLVSAVQWHHLPEKADQFRDLAAILNLAEAIAHTAGLGAEPGGPFEHPPSAYAQEALGITPELWALVAENALERTAQMEKMLRRDP